MKNPIKHHPCDNCGKMVYNTQYRKIEGTTVAKAKCSHCGCVHTRDLPSRKG